MLHPPPAPSRPATAPQALLLALAASAGCAQLDGAPPPAPPAGHAVPGEAAGARALRDGLALLDEALAMRRQAEQWEDVRPAAEEAAALLAQARAAERGIDSPAEAGLVAAEALVVWQSLVTTGLWAEPPDAEPVARSRAAAAAALLRLLEPLAPRTPQARAVRVVLLAESGQPDASASELRRGLAEAPDHHGLHEILRASGVRPGPSGDVGTPTDLLELLGQLGSAGPAARAEADTSRAFVLRDLALARASGGRLDEAAGLHEQAAEAFALALAAEDPPVSRLDLAGNQAFCLANAGWLRLQLALDRLPQDGLDAVRADLLAAERLYGDALALRPDDPDARAGLAQVADAYYQAGNLPGARDAFGRLARRFDDAEWWNNLAFFCRETGEYEASFAAYERCIELAPDDARYVNDTALILLYHLQRDLDHAEQLFRRAIDLARGDLDNPFLDDATRENRLLACGDAMLNLALLLAQAGRLDEAAAQLDELLALSPGRPDALELRAQVDEARRAPAPPDGTAAVPRNP
jgi:tetratricopeptide (TPR) repeat protein